MLHTPDLLDSRNQREASEARQQIDSPAEDDPTVPDTQDPANPRRHRYLPRHDRRRAAAVHAQIQPAVRRGRNARRETALSPALHGTSSAAGEIGGFLNSRRRRGCPAEAGWRDTASLLLSAASTSQLRPGWSPARGGPIVNRSSELPPPKPSRRCPQAKVLRAVRCGGCPVDRKDDSRPTRRPQRPGLPAGSPVPPPPPEKESSRTGTDAGIARAGRPPLRPTTRLDAATSGRSTEGCTARRQPDPFWNQSVPDQDVGRGPFDPSRRSRSSAASYTT